MNVLDPVRSQNGYFTGIKVYEEVNGTLGVLLPPVRISETDVDEERQRRLFPVSTLPVVCPAWIPAFLCRLELKVRTLFEEGQAVCAVGSVIYLRCESNSSREIVSSVNHLEYYLSRISFHWHICIIPIQTFH